jgi:hypothetical protein
MGLQLHGRRRPDSYGAGFSLELTNFRAS